MKMVIIGNGPAAIAAVRAIRNNDKECEITVIAERETIYSPCMLPNFIAGEISLEHLCRCGTKFWRDMNVTAITGRAVQINRIAKVILLANNQLIGYNKLLLATGAKAKDPHQKNKQVFYIRTLSDAIAIERALSSATEAVVIGAGCVGIETALALYKKKLKVTLIESASQILPSMLDPDTAGLVMDRLIKFGMNIRLNCFIRPSTLEEEIHLSKKNKMICVIAVGIIPNTELARTGGIYCRQNVIVDDHMNTGVTNIFAAGDVTSTSNTAIWPNAVKQGAIAGLNMIGINQTLQPAVRSNTIDIAGLTVFSAGMFPDDAEVFKMENRKLWVKNNAICGIIEIGQNGKFDISFNMINKKLNTNLIR